MAADMAALMTALGHERFQVASHDRGARVAHRLALDAPKRVQRLAVLDIVPTIEHFERTDMAFALGYYHWFWFAQPHPKPESIINAAPDAWFDAHTSRDGEHDFFDPEALADYRAAARDPATIAGMCEDYRAAASIDLEHDRQSRLREAGAVPAAGAVGREGPHRRLVRSADAVAGVLRRPREWRPRALGPLPRRGGAGGRAALAGAVPGGLIRENGSKEAVLF